LVNWLLPLFCEASWACLRICFDKIALDLWHK
jgi:hypothetical protein